MGSMDQIAWLAWVDLETSGTNEHAERILEIAVVLTRPDLSDQQPPFHALVFHDDLEDVIAGMIPVVRQMHEANGLIEELRQPGDRGGAAADPANVTLDVGAPRPMGAIDQDLRAWLKFHSKPRRSVMIAGSGVGHFDRRFVKRYMGQTDSHLHHPAFDVGALRRMVTVWAPWLLRPTEQVDHPHRALPDVLDHIAEARHYADILSTVAVRSAPRLPNGFRFPEGSTLAPRQVHGA